MEELRWLFKPSCPDADLDDCPLNCCVFWCMFARGRDDDRPAKTANSAVLKTSRPLAGSGESSLNGLDGTLLREPRAQFERSLGSIHSNDNTTSSTLQEDELDGDATRVSSEVTLNQSPTVPPRYSMENLQPNDRHLANGKPKGYHSQTMV